MLIIKLPLFYRNLIHKICWEARSNNFYEWNFSFLPTAALRNMVLRMALRHRRFRAVFGESWSRNHRPGRHFSDASSGCPHLSLVRPLHGMVNLFQSLVPRPGHRGQVRSDGQQRLGRADSRQQRQSQERRRRRDLVHLSKTQIHLGRRKKGVSRTRVSHWQALQALLGSHG